MLRASEKLKEAKTKEPLARRNTGEPPVPHNSSPPRFYFYRGWTIIDTLRTCSQTVMSAAEASIYEKERREKLQKLRDLGIEPFGGRTAGVTPLAGSKGVCRPDMRHDGGPLGPGAGRAACVRALR